jgi:hypothetical protein
MTQQFCIRHNTGPTLAWDDFVQQLARRVAGHTCLGTQIALNADETLCLDEIVRKTSGKTENTINPWRLAIAMEMALNRRGFRVDVEPGCGSGWEDLGGLTFKIRDKQIDEWWKR